MIKEYQIYISHSWTYSDSYKKIIALINKGDINFNVHSVPKDDLVHTEGTNAELSKEIRKNMVGTNCIIILAGVYATYTKWIDEEIKIAKKHGKRIIAIEHWGAERTSQKVKDNADMIVKWQTNAIISAIIRP